MDRNEQDWQLNMIPRVLLADDSISNRIQIKRLLNEIDIQIMESESGLETVQLVSRYEFGAILLDIHMKDMSGFEAAEMIKKTGAATYTPIIFLSGPALTETEMVRGYETGGVDSIRWTDLPVVLPAKLNFYLNHYKQRKELESANRTKSEFLSNMSHELRTPLNSILVLAQLLADNSEHNLNEKQLKFANTIYSSGTDLLNLINDILDLSKVESGMMQFVIDEVELSGFLKDVERKITYTAGAKGLDFKVTLEKNLPDTIQVDGVRVHQILNNLLSNAIKFTDSGSVVLRVFCPDETITTETHQILSGNAVAFSVTDSGIGIPEEKKNLIFEAFRQADGSIKRKYGGTGLGLSISKKLASIMGGDLFFESIEGQGSTFTLYLPLAPSGIRKDDTVLVAIEPPESNRALQSVKDVNNSIPPAMVTQLKGKRALLVEDDIINIYVMLALLDKVQMEAVVASNGMEALEKLKSEMVDLVLMDMMMPDMDGYEATSKIKSQPETASLPVVAVTAKAMKGDREKCFKAGADGYVTKPILASTLFTEIFECLNTSPK
ncbi:MAG: response regulator [Deltaproteobacteria bacterium]|nr:response regulator [Deltaproteobacteria bacterium]